MAPTPNGRDDPRDGGPPPPRGGRVRLERVTKLQLVREYGVTVGDDDVGHLTGRDD